MATGVNNDGNQNPYANVGNAFAAGAAGAVGMGVGQLAVANPVVAVPLTGAAYLFHQTKDAPVHSVRQRAFACVVRAFGWDIVKAPSSGSTICELKNFEYKRESTGIIKNTGCSIM